MRGKHISQVRKFRRKAVENQPEILAKEAEVKAKKAEEDARIAEEVRLKAIEDERIAKEGKEEEEGQRSRRCTIKSN